MTASTLSRISVVVAVLALSACEIAFTDIGRARQVSGLAIPRSGKVEKPLDEYGGPQGNGQTEMIIMLDPEAFARIATEASAKGYSPLVEKGESGFLFLGRRVGPRGWFLKPPATPDGSSKMIVLDERTHTVLIRFNAG